MESFRNDMKKRIWRLIYPSLTYTGIMYIVALVAMTFIMVGMLDQIDASIITGVPDQMNIDLLLEEIEKLYPQLMKAYYEKVVLIQGIAALVALPVMLLYLRLHNKRRAESNIVKEPADRAPVWMVLMFVFGAIASYAGNGMISLSGLSQADEEFNQIAEMIYQGNIVLEIVSLGILAPVVEELIFRGLMYTQMTEFMKKSRAVVVAAVLFGIYHGNLLQGIYATALGLLMIYVYERFHTLVAPILFHVGSNIFGILMTETEVFSFLYNTDGAFFTSVIMSSLLIIGVVWLVERRVQNSQIVENSEV